MKKLVAIILAVVMAFSFTGCIHKHVYKEADCTTPRTCEKCGKTEGEPLGHTVEVGKCERCGAFVNYDLFKTLVEIDSEISKDTLRLLNAVNILDGFSARIVYKGLKDKESDLLFIRDELENFEDLCGDYEELKEIKAAAQVAISKIPSPLLSDTPEAVADAYGEYIAFAEAQMVCAKSMQKFAASLAE